MNWKKCLMITAALATGALAGPVSYYGELKASGNKLVGAKNNKTVQVRGVSLGWSNSDWESADFFNATTVNAMVEDWKAEVIRVPLGYSELGGYQQFPNANLTRVEAAIDAAIANDVYVIIDWHSHSAHNETDAAKTYFASMAQKYGKNDHVIFEVYNEPLNADWNTIRNYATQVITTIRQYSDNLILVGTPFYSQDVDHITTNPISDSNLGYVFHFYAATHDVSSGYGNGNKKYSEKILAALNADVPVFVTEYGTTSADGGDPGSGNYNTHSASATNAWHAFMDTYKISSVAWNVNDKYEGSAFFSTNFDQLDWANTNKMTESGKYIYNKLLTYAASAEWRSAASSSSSAGTSSSSSAGTSSSSSSVPGSSSSAAATGVTILDDFSDEDNRSYTGDFWYIYTDVKDKGASTVTNTKNTLGDYEAVFDDGTGNFAAAIKGFSLKKGSNPYDPYVAIGLDVAGNGSDYDLSQCSEGFSYRYKGAGHTFQAAMGTVTDYNYHGKSFTTTTSWTTVTIRPDQLEQANWGANTVLVDFDAALVEKFAWQIKTSPTSGNLWIDDFQCLGADLALPELEDPESSSSGTSSSSVGSSSSTGSSSSSSNTPSSSSAAPLGYTVLDDFNDEDNLAYTGDYWYIYTDVKDKGASTVTNAKNTLGDYEVIFDDGTGNFAAAIKSFSLKKGSNPYDPYVAIGLDLAGNGSDYNLSQCSEGFSYRYKGAAHGFQAAMSSVANYNYHTYAATASTGWKTVTVSFNQLEQADWGENTEPVDFDAALIEKFAWQIKATPTSGNLWIDDFRCLGADLALPELETPGSSSSSGGSSSSSSSSGSGSSDLTILDDFTDKGKLAFTGDYWYVYTDVKDKGSSTVANEKDGLGDYKVVFNDGTGNYAAAIKGFSLKQGDNPYDPYVALGLDVTGNGSDYNLSQCSEGFSYRYKGAAHGFQAAMSSVTNYNYHTYAATASTGWKTVTISFGQLKQADWGENTEPVDFDAALIEKFAWQIKATPTSGNLWVDDFKCLGADLGLAEVEDPTAGTADDNTPVLAQSAPRNWNIKAGFNSVNLQVGTGTVTLEIYDIKGQPVQPMQTFTAGDYRMELGRLAPGMYWVRTRQGSHHQTIRLAVQ